MSFDKGGYTLSSSEKIRKDYNEGKFDKNSKKWAPKCPDCGAAGIYIKPGQGMCSGTPGWHYKFKSNPNAGKTKIKGNDFVKEDDFIITDTEGSHE